MNSQLVQYEKIAGDLAEQGYSMVDEFLSKQEMNRLLQMEAFRMGLSQFKKAGVGKTEKIINADIRGDLIQWIDRTAVDPGLRIYLDRLAELIPYLNQNLFLSLKDFEMHLTIYPAGGYYQRHLDQFKRDDHRRLSVIFYLNDNWEVEHGGQLRMHLPEGPVDFFPIAGRFICFRSDLIDNERLPASRDRLILTGWILNQ